MSAIACPTCGEYRPELLAIVANDWMTGEPIVTECQVCGQAFTDAKPADRSRDDKHPAKLVTITP